MNQQTDSTSFERPDGAAQRRVQALANESPMARRASDIQSLADGFSSRRDAPIQGKFTYESSLANGWYAFLKNYSSRLDLFDLVEQSDDLHVDINASDNNVNMKNKLGATIGMIQTPADEFVPVKFLNQSKHAGKMGAMKAMWITINVFGRPLVGKPGEEAVAMPRSLEEQLVTFAHEWHLHAVPDIELYQSIKRYQEDSNQPTGLGLGLGEEAVNPGVMSEFLMNDELKKLLSEDQHQDYKRIAGFMKSIIDKSEGLKEILELQEDSSVIEKIVSGLDQALKEQSLNYDWDDERLVDELSKLL